MPMPSACRISEAAAICVATEMRCITNGMNLRVDHVASASNSALGVQFAAESPGLLH